MNPKFPTILIAILATTVILAGCVDSEGPKEANADQGDQPVDLGSNGAISGLVVDDNYRPVQLKEEWGNGGPGEFQDLGFVLILETGQRFTTSENGEFSVLPLKPGKYTIRVAADNHEAKDTIVNVVSGEYTEITLEARRQYSAGGSVLSQEYVIFIACSVSTTVISLASVPTGCGDTSGDSERASFSSDYSSYAPDIRAMVTEIRVHQNGYAGTAIRGGCDHAAEDAVNGCVYAEFDVERENRWGKAVLYSGLQRLAGHEKNFAEPANYIQEGEEGYCRSGDGKAAEDCTANGNFGRYLAWDPINPFDTILFSTHANKAISDAVFEPFWPQTCTMDDTATIPWVSGTTTVGKRVQAYACDGNGNGVTLGTKAQYVQNVFLYELPEAGIEDYCILCEDADVPE